jgi:predicted GIY-YIG superfamily endonuclease
MSEYQVYVLRNLQGRHYIGLTGNVVRRLDQHNAGASKWTAKHGPWALVWESQAMGLSEARKLENLLKRQKGGEGFYRLTGLSPGS